MGSHLNTYHRGPPPRVDKNGVVYIVVGEGRVGSRDKRGHHLNGGGSFISTKLIWLPIIIIE